MQKIAVCVSGSGTNLQAIIDAVHSGKIHNTQIAVVISNKADAYALERANNAGIPALFPQRNTKTGVLLAKQWLMLYTNIILILLCWQVIW